MIVGIGTDIIEIKRIRSAIQQAAFRNRVFTEREQEYCDRRGMQSAASYAARFAGKEAVMKALGTGLAGGKLLEIEIMPTENGKPEVFLTGAFASLAERLGATAVHLSLSHCREYATAHSVIWGRK